MCCTKASSVMWEKLSSALLVFVCGKFCFCDENEWEMKEKSEEEEKLYEITQKRSGSVRSTQWRFIYDVRRKLCEMPSITINFAFIFGPFCAVLNLVAALSPAPSLAGLLCPLNVHCPEPMGFGPRHSINLPTQPTKRCTCLPTIVYCGLFLFTW